MWLLQHHKLNNFLKSLFKKRFLNFSMWLINHCFCSTFMSKIKDTRLVFIHAGKMFWFLSTKVHCVAPAKGRLCVHNNRRGHLSKELFWAWHLKTGLKTCVERKQNCGCKALSLIQKKKKKDQSVPLLFWHLRTVTYWITEEIISLSNSFFHHCGYKGMESFVVFAFSSSESLLLQQGWSRLCSWAQVLIFILLLHLKECRTCYSRALPEQWCEKRLHTL